MDEMEPITGEGMGAEDDTGRLTRDPLWRSLVVAGLGTTVRKATRIEQHQLQEIAALKKQLAQLRREVKALVFICKVPVEITMGLPRHSHWRRSCPRREASCTLTWTKVTVWA